MRAEATAEADRDGRRDFVLTDADFERLRTLVREHTGIALSDAKRQLVYGRLTRRLRALGLDSFGEYVALVERGEPEELEEFTNAITTNLTSFFREQHHFDWLASTGLPEIVQKDTGARRIRIWSCASSTGEEPYSIAITLREHAKLLDGFDVKLLATDLDSQVLATATAGVYPFDRVRALPEARVRKWFLRGSGANADFVRVRPELQSLITFRQLNLMHQWPMSGPFDIIFCRNVVIYFDKPTQRVLFERMAALQQPGALLFLGHSESLYRVSDKYDLIGRTMYRRNDK